MQCAGTRYIGGDIFSELVDTLQRAHGGFRFINLRRSPFDMPRPLLRIQDFIAPEPPRCLGLWSREQIFDVVKCGSGNGQRVIE
jgi:hypothetical protein